MPPSTAIPSMWSEKMRNNESFRSMAKKKGWSVYSQNSSHEKRPAKNSPGLTLSYLLLLIRETISLQEVRTGHELRTETYISEMLFLDILSPCGHWGPWVV